MVTKIIHILPVILMTTAKPTSFLATITMTNMWSCQLVQVLPTGLVWLAHLIQSGTIWFCHRCRHITIHWATLIKTRPMVSISPTLTVTEKLTSFILTETTDLCFSGISTWPQTAEDSGSNIRQAIATFILWTSFSPWETSWGRTMSRLSLLIRTIHQ